MSRDDRGQPRIQSGENGNRERVQWLGCRNGEMIMRIWLAECSNGRDDESLESVLRQILVLPDENHTLVGVRPLSPSSAAEFRAQQVDTLIVADSAAPPD